MLGAIITMLRKKYRAKRGIKFADIGQKLKKIGLDPESDPDGKSESLSFIYKVC